MVGLVVLYLSLLASAVSLKSPLPPYLPPAAEARQRLVTKLQQLEVVRRRLVRGGSDSLLYLAYVLAMKDIITELDRIGRIFQSLFGIVGEPVLSLVANCDMAHPTVYRRDHHGRIRCTLRVFRVHNWGHNGHRGRRSQRLLIKVLFALNILPLNAGIFETESAEPSQSCGLLASIRLCTVKEESGLSVNQIEMRSKSRNSPAFVADRELSS